MLQYRRDEPGQEYGTVTVVMPGPVYYGLWPSAMLLKEIIKLLNMV